MKKIRYKLVKYGAKTFPSGDTISYYPIKSVELTKQQIEWTIEILEATKYVIDCETYRNKLKEILK